MGNRRITSWLCIIGIAALLAVPLLPIGRADSTTFAASPRLTLNKNSAQPGATVTATGRRFPESMDGALIWDGDGSVLATFQTTGSGTFTVRFEVPDSAGGISDVTAVVGDARASASLDVAAAPPPTETPEPWLPAATDVPKESAPTDVPEPKESEPAPTTSSNWSDSTGTSSESVSANAAEQTLTFPADADAWVDETAPSTNRGRDSTLRIDGGPHQEAFLTFTVSGVSGSVRSATIRVYMTSESVSGPEVYGVGNGWTETDLTWNTRPARTTAKLDNLDGDTGDDVWREFDVQAMVTANGTYSFVFSPTSGDGLAFSSKEGINPPQLVVAFDSGGSSAPSPTPLPTATNGPASTPTKTPTPGATATPASALSPLVGSIEVAAAADALVKQDYPSSNYGRISTLVADGTPVEESYLRFQVSGTGGSVARAILRLYVTNGTTIPIQVYRVEATWTETGLTWGNRPVRVGTVSSQLPFLAVNTWVDFDVTSFVSGDGAVSFVVADTHADGAVFSSRETVNPPRLYVVPGVAGASPATATPTPAGTETAVPTPTGTATPTTSATPQAGGSVTAAGETAPVPHGGDAADDPAIWIHPSNPSLSTIIGTDKLGGLAVYDLAGNQVAYYADGAPNNVDLRYNFPLGGQRVDLVVASETASDSLRIYKVDPTTRGLIAVHARTISTGIGVAGLCMYHSPVTGKYYAFVGDSSGTNQQWELFDNGAGLVDARKVRTISLSSVTEGIVADDGAGALYISQEDVALWRYGAEPGDGSARSQVDSVGTGHLTADVEGLAIYYGGSGYLIASSQGNDEYAVYQRGGGNAYLGTFEIGTDSVDGVTHTDGLDVTNAALGGAYGSGLFVAQDDRNDGGNQNFKLVPWDRIAGALGLAVDTGYNPRAVGSGDPAPPSATPTATPTTPPTTSPTPTPTPTATPDGGTAGAKTYYVDSVSGNDSNTGTSSSSPWKSLTKANSAPLAPGDRLLFKRGGTWQGKLKLSRSGTSSKPIIVGSYGSGNLPIIQGSSGCVALSASYVTLREIKVSECSWAGIELSGNNNLIQDCVVTRNVAGIYVRSGATGNRILGNQIVDNNRMSVLTPGGSDDSGAFGVLLHGDNTEIAGNVISGSAAFSYDYGVDGAAIEVYGGRNNHIHHNRATDNDAFAELGNSRSADNTFAYNVVRSSLDGSVFLVTRGSKSGYGPVYRTRAFNNTVVMTGASSQGVVCSSGCSSEILTMRNNVIQAVWKAGYADAKFDEDYNVYFGGIVQFTPGSHSVIADPKFVNAAAGDFRLSAASPAIDLGLAVGYATDVAGGSVPLDGDGDGTARPDAGAYEYRR